MFPTVPQFSNLLNEYYSLYTMDRDFNTMMAPLSLYLKLLSLQSFSNGYYYFHSLLKRTVVLTKKILSILSVNRFALFLW